MFKLPLSHWLMLHWWCYRVNTLLKGTVGAIVQRKYSLASFLTFRLSRQVQIDKKKEEVFIISKGYCNFPGNSPLPVPGARKQPLDESQALDALYKAKCYTTVYI